MPGLLGYLGFGGSSTPEKPTPVRALPASWYTSREMYELQRRAIFSRQWLFLTHKSRLQEIGDFLRYEIAGYDIIINLDRQGNVRAHHNICRHRAYPVVEEKEGRAKIFSCKYHGWSYSLNGKLAKAPQYDDLDGFDKEQNGLFRIHTRIDANGFIWINMDSSDTPEVPWEKDFQDVDKQERFEQFNFDDYVLDHTYEFSEDYSFIAASDNFNECYHCKTTHPDVPTFLTIDAADVAVKDGHMQHDHASTPEQRAKGFNINSTFYFPNASMSVSPHFLMIQKFLPHGPRRTTMQYEIYKNKHSAYDDFKLIADTYARVMAEDKVLCRLAQDNLNRGVFVNGQLHPRWEKGPLFFQKTLREKVTEHYAREKKEGREIWPARQKVSGESVEDEEICNGLRACGGGEKLEW